MQFTGISPEAVFLLAENRFNNSKSFYDAHKQHIKDGIVIPLRQIVEDVSDIMLGMNKDMILQPNRCISRVRRDTRYTHDKSMYRENMWIMFRHQKNELPTPALWFEFFPDRYDFGCGLVSATPAFMEFWRKEIVVKDKALLAAVHKAEAAGLLPDCDLYKRSKADAYGIGGKLKYWYDSKSVFLTCQVEGLADLNNPDVLINKLREAYTAAAPFYKYCLQLTTKFNCSTEV